ncbi:Histidine kinase-, DNA gyrase B-, and HSP90-like ATPase [Paenibacillus sp. UNCCL117]|uniref:sensor histidine kinase n=1 Tax=unclassified Paenibacillus TaxID=185978 RepID=UPI0008805289|nr:MULTISPECIES: sensor histidine kinase [unclassified Paenibacillus]SDD65803.1 Histidine kinase-, DNA gyrase B-, and HSP90-like ATPase [Paenibacillus sp. cl123]SFW58053.1 Histidine kinase-, DNA gyrase B-, and HSP90-like ATPase [Paenibacillus sp. UNCCL117]
MLRRLSNPLHSIRGKLVISLLLFVIIPTLLIFWNFAYTSKEVIVREVNQANQELADRSAKSVNDVAMRMSKALFLLETDFQEYYGSGLSDWTEDYADYAKVHLLQRRMTTIRDLLLDSSAFLIYADYQGLAVSTLYSFDMKQNYPLLIGEDWYARGKQSGGFPQWILPFHLDPRIGSTGVGSEGGYFAMSRSLRDKSDFGAALIGVPVQSVFANVNNPGKDAYPLLLWDQQHALTDLQGEPVRTLTEPEVAELRQGVEAVKQLSYDGRTYMANVSSVTEIGVAVVSLIPQEDFLTQLNTKQNESILSILAVFLFSILVFVLLLIRFTKPIYSMLRSMKQVGTGDFQASVPVKGNDEIALLGNNFNRMVVRLRELLHRLETEQKQKEEAHFQALQAQINPHFLFNTLNSIKLMAMLSQTNRNVSDMITVLGKLLEFSMKMNQRFVTLGQEVEYLELYMSLQKIRYPDQIRIDVHVPPGLQELYVLKFSLQPLIENSIIHGGRMPLHITVDAEIADRQLQIVIRDNGNGIAEDKLAELQSKLVMSHAKYSGIGLSNVDRRIKLHFGPDFGIKLRNMPTGGLETLVLFPLRKEPPDDDEHLDRR